MATAVLLLSVLTASAERGHKYKTPQDLDGFRFLSTGACALNEHGVHKYGISLAASDTILATGGDDGLADVQCISVSCEFISSLQFWWDSSGVPASNRSLPLTSPSLSSSSSPPPPRRGLGGVLVHTSEEGLGSEEGEGEEKGEGVEVVPYISQPMCERGGWQPLMGGVVQVAVHDTTVAFAGAGCVEMSKMGEHGGWDHIVSLPAALPVTCVSADGADKPCGSIVPQHFASQIAMDDGVLLASAVISAERAVVSFMRIGSSWEQTDVLTCEECTCSGESDGCFGAALAVHDDVVVVGYPANGSVLVFRRHLIPSKPLAIAWRRSSLLTSPSTTLFGHALAMGPSLLVVGFPSPMNSGAQLFSVMKGVEASSAVSFKMIFDSRDVCCDVGLPCCDSNSVGRAVAVSELSHYAASSQATVAVGDPFSSQVHAFTCNLTSIRLKEKAPCQMSAAILPGYERCVCCVCVCVCVRACVCVCVS